MITKSKIFNSRITEFDKEVGYTLKKDNSQILSGRAKTFYNPAFTLRNERKDEIIQKLPPINNDRT